MQHGIEKKQKHISSLEKKRVLIEKDPAAAAAVV
jgi:hypothetical protein